MVEYKVVDADKLDSDLTVVADAIRERAGTSAKMDFPTGFADAVKNIPSGTELPPLSNPGTAADMASGKELIDQYGNVVTGTLGEVAEGQMLGANQNKRMVFNSGRIRIAADTTGEAIVRPGATLMTDISASEFGDATAADVVAGKTFTSAEGLKVVGTASGGGGFTVTDDGAGNVTITSDAITDNDGDVVIA